ncbi:hypothetical protein BDE36_0583 [Arcticibacter tournemirensis]|nr:hypothetical protein BDE36_0583 [Arcticibacter tournemirensis]
MILTLAGSLSLLVIFFVLYFKFMFQIKYE